MHNNLKKIVIITYYWPPAGGPGVQRWLKFVKYLTDFGIEPHVYIPENPTYPIVDEKLLDEVSTKAIIIKQKIKEPYALASVLSKKKTKQISAGILPKDNKQTLVERAMLWIRGNFFIPDARVKWVKPSVKFLKSYLQKNQINTIITTGPPHSLHLIGLQLKKELQLNWLADFRDPWTTIGYHNKLKLTSFAKKKHQKLERDVLNSCNHITVTSPTTKREFEKITNRPISVITNGYDVENVARKPLDTKFSLAHIGSLLSDRNPIVLWECLSEIIAENESFANFFQLKLIGTTSVTVLASIKEYKLDNFTKNIGYVTHDIVLQEQRCSQVLLLIEINSEATKGIIPGKLFEYMVSDRPIVALGPENADFSEIIKTTNTGMFFNYSEKEKLKTHFLKLFNQFQEGKLQVFPVGLQKYSRKNLTKELVAIIP